MARAEDLDDFERLQAVAHARPLNAHAIVKLESRAVRSADEVAARAVEEVTPAAIERHAKVRTRIYVGPRHSARPKRECGNCAELKYQVESMDRAATIESSALEDRRRPTWAADPGHQNG